MTKNIFNWNHISSNLTQDQITELKEYYQTYHRKCWAFKQAAKLSKNGNYWVIHYQSCLQLVVSRQQ